MTPLLPTIAAWGLLAFALLGAAYTLVAAELLVRRVRSRPCDPAHLPAVSLLKPLHGDHRGLYDDLESFLLQDYPAPVQVVCGVSTAGDGAIKVVRALQAAHPRADLQIVIDGRQHGSNRKVSNLVNIAERATAGTLVLSDSDIRVGSDYLRRVVSSLDAPGVGAATCLYVGRPEAGVWPMLSALGSDQHFLSNVAFGLAFGLAQPCFGATVAFRRETLERIGGFHAVADKLADDYELGRAVRALGLSVVIPPLVVRHAAKEFSGRAVLSHELRWARTVKGIDPAGYAGSILTNPLPLALIGAALAEASPAALGALALVLASRLYLAVRVARATDNRPGPLWLTPVRDILSFIVYLASFGSDSVSWGGESFQTDASGRLSPRAPQ